MNKVFALQKNHKNKHEKIKINLRKVNLIWKFPRLVFSLKFSLQG